MKKISTFLTVFFLLSCSGSENDIESKIYKLILDESSSIASLEAIYLLQFTHFNENLITSDDVYIQTDIATQRYGFKIDKNCIKVVDRNGKKILMVTLPNGQYIATNRKTLGIEKTHDQYRPISKDGEEIDVDAQLSQELAKLRSQYEDRYLALATENIKNFFRIIAARYKLELEFQIN
jgi:hypothetical protein